MYDPGYAQAQHAFDNGNGDLQYVADVLSGAPSQNSRRYRPKHKQRTDRMPTHAPTARSSSAQQAPVPVVAQYNRPSKGSNSKQYFCEACKCYTAAREQDWQMHIVGIKHQRQMVSLQHTGQLGNLLPSVFEAEPGADL